MQKRSSYILGENISYCRGEGKGETKRNRERRRREKEKERKKMIGKKRRKKDESKPLMRFFAEEFKLLDP